MEVSVLAKALKSARALSLLQISTGPQLQSKRLQGGLSRDSYRGAL